MANLQIDASKTAAANLLAIINSGNTGQTITAAQVTFGAPSVKTDTGDGRNTSVVVTAVGGQGFSGTQTVNYTRRGLNDSVASPVDSYTATDGEDAATILAALATQLGLVLAEVQLEDPANPGVALTGAQSGNQATLNVVSKANSLVYVDGSTQAITMTWNAEALSTAIPNVDLPGFANAAGTL